jgi:hypothetical protein
MLLDLLRFLIYVLAIYRIADFIVQEDGPYRMMDRTRKAIGKRAAGSDDEDWTFWRNLAELIYCPYCVGIWAGLILLPLMIWPGILGDIFLLWLGGAGGQAFLEGQNVNTS